MYMCVLESDYDAHKVGIGSTIPTTSCGTSFSRECSPEVQVEEAFQKVPQMD